jgi:hypothetical protein
MEAFDLILEPSAGDGVFLEFLPLSRTTAFDLDPRHPKVERRDFFDWRPPRDLSRKSILTIGNPPFGARGSLAIRFINHACSFSEVVAFILPRSFKKHTFITRIDPSFHCLEQADCSDFRKPDGSPVNISCVFQIWQRQTFKRVQVELDSKHPDFEVKHFHLSRTSIERLVAARSYYDFAVPQVGGRFTTKSMEEVERGSYWFVKENISGLRDVFDRLDYSFVDGMNTAHRSLSVKDIILAYKNAIGNKAMEQGNSDLRAQTSLL